MAGLHATIGVLAALNPRHETGRGQHVEVNLLSSALSGLVNQSSAYVAGGVVPIRMGNSHPSLFPYEPLPCSDGDLIITAGNNGQFRKLVEVLGVPELADDPRFARNEDRTANRDQLRPLLVERLRDPHQGRVVPRHHRRRRALRADQHHRRRRRLRRGGRPRPGRRGRRGRRAVPSVRNPITVLRDAAGLPAAAAGAGRARRRRSGAGWPSRRPPTSDRRDEPDDRRRWSSRPRWAPRRPTRSGCSGQDLTADLMGKVGFGELAFWLVAMRRPTPSEMRVFEAVLVALADHGFTPTAIAARLTYLSAPDSLQGALAAGLLGGGSRFLGVTEDCGGYLHDVLDAARGRRCPTTTPAGTRWPWRRSRATRAAGRFVPGLGHPVHKERRPAHAGADRHRRGGGPARPAPAAVRGDRPGPRAGARPAAAAQRRRGLRRRAGRPRAARSSCCAASRCWPAPPGCSASSPRSGAGRSAWTSTSPSTATRCTSTPS